jgi:hypothetical protein
MALVAHQLAASLSDFGRKKGLSSIKAYSLSFSRPWQSPGLADYLKSTL